MLWPCKSFHPTYISSNVLAFLITLFYKRFSMWQLETQLFAWPCNYGCWNVAKIEIFIVCFIFMLNKVSFWSCFKFMLYKVSFYLYISYLCYMFCYIFVIYLYVHYVFLNFVIFLFSHYLILNFCDNVFIFIICTKLL